MKELQKIILLLLEPHSELREIIFVTLKMSFFSTFISFAIGVSLGYIIAKKSFLGKKIVIKIIHTWMGLPPVVGGLFVFLLLSRSGPLGELHLLYSVPAMVLAQVILITPISLGISIPIFENYMHKMKETLIGLNFNRKRQMRLYIHESKKELYSLIATSFGRSIAEVGAVSLVGGNIQYKTRVMTTAIMLETNRGNFSFSIALGIVLLCISFFVNIFASGLHRKMDL